MGRWRGFASGGARVAAVLLALGAGSTGTARAEAAEAPAAVATPGGSALGDGVSGVAPQGTGAAAKAAGLRVRRVALGALDVAVLRAEDSERLRKQPKLRTLRTGVRRGMPLAAAPRRMPAGGRGVTVLGDGTRVWTLEVASPGAKALRLHFANFLLPDGASAVLYDADEPSESYGPFTGAGPGDAGSFHAPTVFGDRVRLEVSAPAGVAGPFTVVVDSLLEKYAERAAAPAGSHGSFRVGGCHNDVACDSSWSSESHAVGRIDMADGGSCSGVLLNDQDPCTTVPWFLTANHCLSTEGEAAGIEIFWDYAALTCNGTVPLPASLPRTAGASLAATSATTDVTLLRLTGTIPSGRTYAGWTSAAQSAGASVIGIHHPDATEMRISFGAIDDIDSSFHNMTWTSGVTEPGSSGSPLFNAAHQVIGQLCCGVSQCGGPMGQDSYGRLDQSWSILSNYLGTSSAPCPPPGGGGGGGGTGGGGGEPVGPAPVGPPLSFYWGLWNSSYLKDEQYQEWDTYLFRPTYPSRPLKLTVQLKGRKGVWARVVDPKGVVTKVLKKSAKITGVWQGDWVVELHAAADAKPARHSIRIKKNF